MPTIRVVIGERPTLLRQGIAALLKLEAEFEVVGEASDSEETWRVCCHTLPHLIVLGNRLLQEPFLTGTPLPTLLRGCCPQAALIVLQTRMETAAQPERALPEPMTFLSPEVDSQELMRVLRTLAHQGRRMREAILVEGVEHGSGHFHITEREREILALISQGLCNKEIAHRLEIGTQTVKNHISHLLEKGSLLWIGPSWRSTRWSTPFSARASDVGLELFAGQKDGSEEVQDSTQGRSNLSFEE